MTAKGVSLLNGGSIAPLLDFLHSCGLSQQRLCGDKQKMTYPHHAKSLKGQSARSGEQLERLRYGSEGIKGRAGEFFQGKGAGLHALESMERPSRHLSARPDT